MKIFRDHHPLPPAARGAVVALGNFDGIHQGHQAVIGRAAAEAGAAGAKLGILTFEPHPRSVFRPNDPPFRLTPFRSKAILLCGLGVDLLFNLRFNRALASRSAEDFVQEILVDGLGIKRAVVGYDFVFGNGRRGTASLLAELGAKLGFAVSIVAPAGQGEELYSSTRVRTLLQSGAPREASVLLGREWQIHGRVEHGDERGRTIGFPTANLHLADYLRPAAGVYAVRAGFERPGADPGATWYDGVANFGTRPTFAGTDLRLEVHLFDFAGDLYGRHLRVALVDYIRPERKFAGIDDLKAQIAKDAVEARTILAKK